MDVGIVGGGVTGLALHHYLSESGVESVVFERASVPGGVIQSGRTEGRVVDHGPQRTRLSPPVASLVDDLGLGEDVVEAPNLPLYVYCEGRLRRVPTDLRSAVTTDLLSWRGKLRVLLEPTTAPPRSGESVEEFLTRSLGREAARRVVGPLYAGLYGAHPDEMPVEHSLGEALEAHGASRSLLAAAARAKLGGSDAPPVVSFADGMATLPRALAARHRDRVRLDTPVRAVRDAGDGVAVETAAGTTTVDDVVLTAPAPVAARLLDSVAPDAADALARLAYNPLAVVHLDAEGGPDAAGYQVQYDEGLVTRGVTCTAALFGRDGMYTCFLGGATAPEAVDWSDAELRATAAREFQTVTGREARTLDVHRHPRGMPARDASWAALDGVETPEGVHLCANYESRAGIPGRIAAARRLADRLGPGAAR